MSKYYNIEEAKKRFLEKTTLSQQKVKEGVHNLNHVCEHLGKTWIEKHFRGSSGLAIFFVISNIGKQLQYIDRVKRYKCLLKNIELAKKDNLTSFLSELSVVSKFAQHKILTHYEPILFVGDKEKVPDFKIKIKDKWIYFEVCSPENIMYDPLTKISNQLLKTIIVDKQYSLFILLARELNQKEIKILGSTSTRIIQQFKNGSYSEDIGDFARIVIDDSDPRIVARSIKVKKNCPVTTIYVIKNYKSKVQKINLQIIFTDERAENLLRKEARHFSKKTSNFIIFYMSGLKKSMPKWASIISRRFDGKMHRRINGVFLADSAMSAATGKIIGKKIIHVQQQNSYSRLDERKINIIKKVLNS